MATAAFKIGDIVQLKSGGPKMTVTDFAVFGRDLVHTSWFAGSKEATGTFPVDALIPVKDEQPK